MGIIASLCLTRGLVTAVGGIKAISCSQTIAHFSKVGIGLRRSVPSLASAPLSVTIRAVRLTEVTLLVSPF